MLITLLAILMSAVPFAPGSLCFESYSGNLCGLLSGNFTQVTSSFREPLETLLPGFSLVILWGGLMGIVWFKTENIMIMSIVGIAVAATITIGGSTGISQTAVQIGWLLVAVSFGVLIFQMLRQRITLFS